jgi:WD40 repeat protein
MFVWQAHQRAVTSLAFGPDGRFLVSVGSEEQVKVWDPFTGAEQFALDVRPPNAEQVAGRVHSALHGLAVSADGQTAAVGYRDRQLILIDLGQRAVSFRDSSGQLLAIKLAPDGTSVFELRFEPHVIRQRRFNDGAEIASSIWWSIGERLPLAFAVSPDGSRIVIEQDTYLWPGACMFSRSIKLKGNIPTDLAFSADMQHLFALVGGKVMVFSLETSCLKTKLKGHNGRITALALTPDGRRLWTASHDATVKCWDAFSLTLDRTYTFHTGGLDCLAVSPDGNVAAVGSGQKGTITLWDLS